jgi:hypothetical protein
MGNPLWECARTSHLGPVVALVAIKCQLVGAGRWIGLPRARLADDVGAARSCGESQEVAHGAGNPAQNLWKCW